MLANNVFSDPATPSHTQASQGSWPHSDAGESAAVARSGLTRGWTAHRVPPLCSRDAQGVTLGDRLAQQVDQRIVDAGVCDTPGSEK
jgi:hypothetical protein